MSDVEPTTTPDASRFESVMRIDSTFAGRMTAAAFRLILLKPRMIIFIVSFCLIVAFLAAVSDDQGGAAAIGLGVAALLVALAIFFLVILFGYFRARNRTRVRFPVGADYSMSMSEDVMRLQDPLVSVEISYKLYKSVRVGKDIVALNPKVGRTPTIVPRELFTPESLAWLTAKVGGTAF